MDILHIFGSINFGLMKRFLILLMMVALTVQAQARRRSDVPQAYAYGSSVDVLGGFVGMPFSVSGDSGNACGIGAGGEFQMRYSHFFGKHLGAFVSFSILGTDIDDVSYFGAVNRADGGRYRYGRLTNDIYSFRNGAELFGCDNSFSAAAFQIGAAYRYDFGGWSLRPMVGIGVGSLRGNSFSYRRIPRDGSAPTGVTYRVTESYLDYMEEPVSDNKSITAVLSASLQLTYTFNRHFYISAECGFKCFPNSFNYEKVSYQFKKAFEPTNWAESVAWSELGDRYVLDMDSAVSTAARLPFNFLNINFGIGWNIGMNRYQSGRYSK